MTKTIVKKIPDKLLKEWNNHIKWLKSTCIEKEDPLNRDARIRASLDDYQFFVKTYFHHYVTYNDVFIPNSLFHNDIAYKMDEDGNLFIGAKWSRGFGKSSHCSLFIPIWLMLKKKTKHILIISKNFETAQNLLSHIQGELEYNQQLIKDFAFYSFKTVGDWSKSSLVINGYQTVINCAGRGQDIRGIRYGSTRPQTIIIDDLDDSELVRNPERVTESFNWLKESVLGTLDIKHFKVIFVENLYSKNSIFYKFLNDIPNIYLSEVNALDINGQSSWPERFTTEELLFIKEQVGSISFNREYMNQPIIQGSIFKMQWFKKSQIFVTNKDRITIYCDLSFSNSGDYKGVSVMTKRGDDLFLIDLYGRKGSVNSVMYWLYDVYEKYHNMGCPVYLYMEAVFGQDKIYEQFKDVSNEKGYRLPFIMDKAVKANKFNRIELSSVYFERGRFFINEDIFDSQDVKNLLDQYMAFGEGSKFHDDIPDSIASNIEKTNKNNKTSDFNPILNRTENVNY